LINHEVKTYGYRWVVLLVFMAITALNQLLWITFAPITHDAAAFYGVSDLSIGLLSLSFMIVYLFVSIPASWTIDRYGFRWAVGIGAVLTGVFGLTRGLLAQDFAWVMVSQIGIAIGQPFILNAVTTIAARWFPFDERATAAGLGSLAIYIGILGGLVLTPYLVLRTDLPSALVLYGALSVVAAALFLIFSREHPPTPAGPAGEEARALMLDGLKRVMRDRNFVILMGVFFVGLGVFNAVTTWVEEILSPRGFSSTQAGVTGGVMIVGGIVGALVLPALSDRSRRRVPFILSALIGASVALLGLTLASGWVLLLASAFGLGFFLLSAGPIGFQYGAEITYPVPEGTSNGLLLLMGQISGIIFIFAMDALKSPSNGSMSVPLLALVGLMLVGLVLSLRLKESSLIGGAASAVEVSSQG
jgi:MFS family permease